jgi:2-polyprenyl-3-methyl-5-hydroxy-6-metoxy-1,4-benzoquinol methylase
MDSIIGESAALRNMEVLSADYNTAIEQLSGRTFDCILACKSIHFAPDPIQVLSTLKRFLNHNGTVVVSVPNYWHGKTLLKRLKGKIETGFLVSQHDRGPHKSSRRLLHSWLASSKLRVRKSIGVVPLRANRVAPMLVRLCRPIIESEVIVLASR